MSDTGTNGAVPAPRQLWIVGVLALLWNAMGAYDYLMTQTENAAYMAKFTPEQLAYFYGFPAWVVAVWALAVWGGVLGSVLLLLRKALAAPVFLVSLMAMVLSTVYHYVFSDGLEMMGGVFEIAFTLMIFIVAVLLYGYARTLQRRGVLT